MDTIRICKQCRKPLPPDAPEGLCPECLARVALGSEPAAPGKRVPPEPAALAAQFPQLEIIELLGMGGMGMVYKARQPKLDRLVALKILPVESGPDAFFAGRFEREAKALARLNHPGIVNVYDFGQTQDFYYFVMEFVDGMNLRQLIRAKNLEPRQALELVTQICTALQFAHDEKIVHRDIKPENILITKKGQVKIADFGLAKLLGSQPDTALTASQLVMGTINYMAPEQRENTKDVDHRADIYSLGVVFYEMLTGEVPMGRFDAPSKKVQIDVRLDEVVLHALEREPSRRYQHVSEVKTNVESISSTMPKAAPVPPSAPMPEAEKAFSRSDVISIAKFILAIFICFVAGCFVPFVGLLMFCAVLLVGARQLSAQLKKPQAPPVAPGVPTSAEIIPKRFHALIKLLFALLVIIGGLCFLSAKELTNSDRGVLLLSVGVFAVSIRFLYQRQQIERARKKGLWPPWGELPTLEHVKGLMQAGETILAIRLFRQIHPVSALDASIAVRKLVPPAPVSVAPPPAETRMIVFWLKAYGLFCAAWLATKFLWNFRGPGCWIACFGLAALVLWISHARMRLFPEQIALYRKISAANRRAALAVNFIILTLGFILLITAFFYEWDMGEKIHGNFQARSIAEYERQYRGKEYHLLQRLPAFEKEIPPVELNAMPGFRGGWWVGWGERRPGHYYWDVGPNLCLGGWIMLSIPFAMIGGFRVKGMKMFPCAWRHVRASLGVFGVILGSAFTVFLFASGNYLTTFYGNDTETFLCETNIDAVTQSIQEWSDANGYAMGDHYDWFIDTVPGGKLVAKARLREAWEPSPFDRWHSTLGTFHRSSPWLAFELVASEAPAQTFVWVTGAMDCDPQPGTNGTCLRIPESLHAVLEKMKGNGTAASSKESSPPAKPPEK